MARNKYLDDNFPSAADVRRTKSNKQVMMEKLHDEVVEWLDNTVKPSILNARLNEETSVNVEFPVAVNLSASAANARADAFGDVAASLLISKGYTVTKMGKVGIQVTWVVQEVSCRC